MKVRFFQPLALISALSFTFVFPNLSADAQLDIDVECRFQNVTLFGKSTLMYVPGPGGRCTSGTITGTIDKSITPTTFCGNIKVSVYKYSNGNDNSPFPTFTEAQTNFQDSNSCIYSIGVNYFKESSETRFSVSASVDNYSDSADPVFLNEILPQNTATRNFVLE